jgi:hypothetical protein
MDFVFSVFGRSEWNPMQPGIDEEPMM